MMRTTTSGRAFTKDMFDLFSTLMISIPIDSNKIRSRNYPNSFWAEKAITSLGGLQFVKSNREADPNDPTRIITHVVTTHFSLTRQMAKNLCQTFMEACLFESVTDPTKREFPNKGLCQITPKGAHLLAKFAYRNKLPLEESQHIKTHATAHLVYLERADDEDALILSKDHVDIIFQRFAGPEPNVSKTDSTSDSSLNLSAASSGNRDRAPLGTDHSNGIHVKDHQHRNGAYKDAFSGVAAVEWLLNYTTVISKEEAGRICQEMVNAQYISQAGEEPSAGPSLFRNNNGVLYHLTDEGRAKAGWKSLEEIDSIKNDWMDERSTIGTKTEGSQPEVSPLSTQFQLTVSNVARLPISILRPQRKSMDESSLASFQYHDAASSRNGASGSSSARRLSQILNDPAFQITLSESSGPASAYAPSSSGRESVGASAGGSMRLSPTMSASQSTTSNTSRLNGILSDTAVRDLFKSFLKQNFCEENLSFYLKVLEYKSKFSTLINTSRAYNQVNSGQEQSIYHPQQSHPHPPSLRELEKQICTQAFAIYETFLASGAPREVNLPHQMRQDITAYMQAVVRNMELADTREGRAKDHAPSSSPSSPSSSSHSSAIGSATDINESGADRASNESELIHIALFDGIHEHIFRLMSTDSVPKFIKTDKYLEVVMKKHKQRKNTVATNGVASMSDDPKAKTAGEAAAVGAGSGLDADGRVDLTGDMGGLNGEDREGGSVSTSGSNRNEDAFSLRRSLSLSNHHRQQLNESLNGIVDTSTSESSYSRDVTVDDAMSPGASLANMQRLRTTETSTMITPRARSASSNVSVDGLISQQLQQRQRVTSSHTGLIVPRGASYGASNNGSAYAFKNTSALGSNVATTIRQQHPTLMDIFAQQQQMQQYSNQRAQLSPTQIQNMSVIRASPVASSGTAGARSNPLPLSTSANPVKPIASLEATTTTITTTTTAAAVPVSRISDNNVSPPSKAGHVTVLFESTSFAIHDPNAVAAQSELSKDALSASSCDEQDMPLALTRGPTAFEQSNITVPGSYPGKTRTTPGLYIHPGAEKSISTGGAKVSAQHSAVQLREM